MNVDTMNELGITNGILTTIILKMTDSSRAKPLGILEQIPTLIANIEYKIDYIVFKTMGRVPSYPGLRGCTWLLDAHGKEDWGKRYTYHRKRIRESSSILFSSQYYGETQDDQTEFNIDDGYKT